MGPRYSGARVWPEGDAQPVVRGHLPPPPIAILTSGGSLPAVSEPRSSSAAGSPVSWRRSSSSAEEQVRGERTPRPPAQPMRPVAGKARRGSAQPAGPRSGILAAPRRSGMLSCARARLVPKRGRGGGFASSLAAGRRPEMRGLTGLSRPESGEAVCFWSIGKPACLPSRCRVPAAAASLRPPLFPQ